MSYNPVTGALSKPDYDPTTLSQSNTTNTLISTKSYSNFNFGQLALDQTHKSSTSPKPAVSDVKDPAGNDYPVKNEIDAISTSVRNATSNDVTHITSLPTYGQSGYVGQIGSLAIDDPDKLIFFTVGGSTIDYVPLRAHPRSSDSS